MTNVVKIRKGLNIHLKGKAEKVKSQMEMSDSFGLSPESFPGLKPKVLVREGDHVKAGEPLFADKSCQEVTFASPVSGIVTAVVRGDRRKVLNVVVKPDAEQEFADFGVKDVEAMAGSDVIAALLKAGLFGYINQLPYDVVTSPEHLPKAIFVSALRDKPLASDFEFELLGNENDFQV